MGVRGGVGTNKESDTQLGSQSERRKAKENLQDLAKSEGMKDFNLHR